MAVKKEELNSFKLALILFIIAGLSAALLSFVYSKTQPVIKKNQKLEEQKKIKIIMPEVKSFIDKKWYYEIYSDKERKKLVGFVIKASGKGYGGNIICNVGIYTNGTVSGIVVISHFETPGLGSKIEEIKKGDTEPYFLKQFKGLTEDKINFNNIQAITGATISSRGVLNCVKMAYKKFNELKKRSINQ